MAESDPDRLDEAIVYVAGRMIERDEKWRGAVKLNKVLWWADFESYRERGTSVTGAEYQRLGEGPAPVQLRPARSRLEADSSIRLDKNDVGVPSREDVIVPQRKPRPIFNAEDLEYFERALTKFAGMTGSQCSEISHKESAGWKALADKETIPYETSIIDPRPLRADELDWARSVATEAGWPARVPTDPELPEVERTPGFDLTVSSTFPDER